MVEIIYKIFINKIKVKKLLLNFIIGFDKLYTIVFMNFMI